MIKVFGVKCDYYNGDEIITSDSNYFAIESENPTLKDAIDMARDIAKDYISGEYNLFNLFDDSTKGEYYELTTIGDETGYPIKEFLQKYDLDDIYNKDDVMDMQFDFEELSDKAQEQAIDDFHSAMTDYAWLEEICHSFKECTKSICYFANADLIDDHCSTFFEITLNNHNIINDDFYGVIFSFDITGKRAYKWLLNHLYLDDCKECKVTGYCDDYIPYKVFKEYEQQFKAGNYNLSIQDYFDNVASAYQRAFNGEKDYQDSDEYAIEELSACDDKFDIDGYKL